jgi:hypothetical protein
MIEEKNQQATVEELYSSVIRDLPAGTRLLLASIILRDLAAANGTEPQVDSEAKSSVPTTPRTLRGIWRGLDTSEEDIAEVRREMWGDFPREDV